MTVDESGGGREECTGVERSGKERFFLGNGEVGKEGMERRQEYSEGMGTGHGSTRRFPRSLLSFFVQQLSN